MKRFLGIVLVTLLALFVLERPLIAAYQLGYVRYTQQIIEIVPPSSYRRWWQEMEDCSGLHRDFSTVRFYVVEGAYFTIPYAQRGPLKIGQLHVLGFYSFLERNIYVAQGKMFTRGLVGHEMLHALGIVGHPAEPFAKCLVIS